MAYHMFGAINTEISVQIFKFVSLNVFESVTWKYIGYLFKELGC